MAFLSMQYVTATESVLSGLFVVGGRRKMVLDTSNHWCRSFPLNCTILTDSESETIATPGIAEWELLFP